MYILVGSVEAPEQLLLSTLCILISILLIMTLHTYMYMQGYIRFRESGCVESLLQSEGLPDVLFSGVEGE